VQLEKGCNIVTPVSACNLGRGKTPRIADGRIRTEGPGVVQQDLYNLKVPKRGSKVQRFFR
jgi:RNA 3'-terminal phosphate cyclase